MCGINGFSGSDRDNECDRDRNLDCDRLLIERMNAVTRNRGPDDTGMYIDERAALGHNRLSIIDLSENGHQPMCNEDGTVWITYNGEVYNFQEIRRELQERGHQFQSNCDTEVIVHAYEEYGYDCVRRFNGMWAFCIYDRRKNELILSRDQFGIKPLYYYVDDRRIIFSSMIGAILCHDVKTAPNDRAIMEYLAFNLEDHDRYTFFEGVYTVPPDSLLIYSLADHSHRFHRWFDLEKAPRGGKDIRQLFVDSVRLRTIADVPIGSCLSGGVDSSAIVCILDRILPDRFYTYSLISPGSRLDESRYIKEVGRVTRTEQHFTTIDRKEVLADLRDFIAAQEEPVTGLSPYAQYRVMKLARENRAKVLLDGQGGDELFAGYVYYYGYYYYELLTKLRLLTLAREMACYRLNFGNFYPHQMLLVMLLPGRVRSALWSRTTGKWVSLPHLKKALGNPRDPRWKGMGLRSALVLTLTKTAIPHLLRWEDKNSMRWSIETRPPFLDVNLLGAALALEPGDDLKDGRTKVAFRQAVRDILPPMIWDRKDKIGFAAPGNELFRDPDMVRFCRNIIDSKEFKSRPYWNWDIVYHMFRSHVEGKINIGDTIWKWINLELWLREYFDSAPAATQARQTESTPLKPVPPVMAAR